MRTRENLFSDEHAFQSTTKTTRMGKEKFSRLFSTRLSGGNVTCGPLDNFEVAHQKSMAEKVLDH